MIVLVLPLLLVACGGNDDVRGQDEATCTDVSANSVASLQTDAWPDGLAELLDTYAGIGGVWSGTLTCEGEADEAAQISFGVAANDALTLHVREGDACAPTDMVTGDTTFTLETDSVSIGELTLATTIAVGSDATSPIEMVGKGVDIALTPEGVVTTAIDKVAEQEGSDRSDATCDLSGLSPV